MVLIEFLKNQLICELAITSTHNVDLHLSRQSKKSSPRGLARLQKKHSLYGLAASNEVLNGRGNKFNNLTRSQGLE